MNVSDGLPHPFCSSFDPLEHLPHQQEIGYREEHAGKYAIQPRLNVSTRPQNQPRRICPCFSADRSSRIITDRLGEKVTQGRLLLLVHLSTAMMCMWHFNGGFCGSIG